jgi:hypothetical protein
MWRKIVAPQVAIGVAAVGNGLHIPLPHHPAATAGWTVVRQVAIVAIPSRLSHSQFQAEVTIFSQFD